MLTLTSPVETWAHRRSAGLKLALLCLWTGLLFQVAAPNWLALAVLLILALIASCGTTFLINSLRLMRPLWPFVLIVSLWHLWQRDISGGATVLLRMFATIAAANLVTMTTRLSDMIAVLTRLTRPLAPLGLQPATLALSVALVIRFIPVMLQRLTQIQDAFRARSASKTGWRILTPTLLAAVDDTDHVAEALRARGGTG